MSGIRTGYYSHYKSTPEEPKFYYVYGLGRVADREQYLALTNSRETAHFSEDPSVRVVVCEAAGVFHGEDTYCVFDPDKKLPPNTQFVVYRALWSKPGDTTPQLAVRPVGGPEGFKTYTPQRGGKKRVKRFRYLGQALPLN